MVNIPYETSCKHTTKRPPIQDLGKRILMNFELIVGSSVTQHDFHEYDEREYISNEIK